MKIVEIDESPNSKEQEKEPNELATKSIKPEKVERNSYAFRDLNAFINSSEGEYLFETKKGFKITPVSTRKIIDALIEYGDTDPPKPKPLKIDNEFIGNHINKEAQATSSKKIVERNEVPQTYNKPEKVERNSTRLRDLNAVINPSDDKYLFKTKDGARITLESTRKIIECDDADSSGPSTSDSKIMGKRPHKQNKKKNLNPKLERKDTSGGGPSAKRPRYENVEHVEMEEIDEEIFDVVDDKEKLPDPDHSTYTDAPLQQFLITLGALTLCDMNLWDESPKNENMENPELKRKGTSGGGSSAKRPRYENVEHVETKEIEKNVFDVVGDKGMFPDPVHSSNTTAPVQNHTVANGASTVREMNKKPDESKIDKDVKTDKKKQEKTLEEQEAEMFSAAQALRMLAMNVHGSVAVFQTPVIWEVDMDSESDNMDL